MTEQRKHRINTRTVIAVLCVLIAVSVGLLVGRVIYLNEDKGNSSTAVVSDNIIGGADSLVKDTYKEHNSAFFALRAVAAQQEDVKATVELYKGQASDNRKFLVTDMLPGDRETVCYAIKVSHSESVALYFNIRLNENTADLADALNIKITRLDSEKVIYDGAFSSLKTDECAYNISYTDKKETVVYYKIEVSLPESAGNEYMAARLSADFTWYVKDDGILLPPETGDNSVFWVLLIVASSFGIMIVLMLARRREREADNENEL